jgi:hypothetical protein
MRALLTFNNVNHVHSLWCFTFLITIISTFSSQSSFAQSEFIKNKSYLERSTPSDLPLEKIVSDPELHLENESIIQDADTDLGVYTDSYFTGKDTNRLSLAIHLTHDYQNISKLSSFEAQILFEFDHYRESWWGIIFKSTTANYSAVADEVGGTGSSNANSNASTLRLDNKQTINSIGPGVGYRFKFLSAWNSSERFYEKVVAFLTYNFHTDATDDRQYTGFGYTADYGLHYRSSERFFYGGKISYNHVALVRDPISDEKKPDRSLVLGWTSLAFEIGYYF